MEIFNDENAFISISFRVGFNNLNYICSIFFSIFLVSMQNFDAKVSNYIIKKMLKIEKGGIFRYMNNNEQNRFTGQVD